MISTDVILEKRRDLKFKKKDVILTDVISSDVISQQIKQRRVFKRRNFRKRRDFQRHDLNIYVSLSVTFHQEKT